MPILRFGQNINNSGHFGAYSARTAASRFMKNVNVCFHNDIKKTSILIPKNMSRLDNPNIARDSDPIEKQERNRRDFSG